VKRQLLFTARLSLVGLALAIGLAAPTEYFVVRVTDEATGRGVPLIELKLPNKVLDRQRGHRRNARADV
jgi:hypothetical protein